MTSVLRSSVAAVVLFCAASATALQAQSTTIGVHGGINFATLSGDDITGAESKTGVAFGGFVSFGLNQTLAIETGATYSQRGSKNSEGGVTAKFNLNYVEVPVLLSARFQGQGQVTPFFSAGPAVAFKVGCGASVSGGDASIGTGCDAIEEAFDIGIKSVDPGMVGVVGVDIKDFRIAARYFLGLSTIDNVSPAYSIKNRVLTLTVGYGFRLN